MGIFGRKKKHSEEPTDEFVERMKADAADCIDRFGDRFPGMDYSVGSLEVVDEMLDELSDFYPEFEPERQAAIQSLIGAYVFEVARRTCGGKYFWYEKGEQPILVAGQPDFEISILAFEKVASRILNGAEDSIPFYFQGFKEKVANARKGDKVMIV